MNGPRNLIIAIMFILLANLSFGSTTDFWITQGGVGSADGSSLANAASCGGAGQSTCSAFNNTSNWGNGSAQIGPGTTIHISGTFTAAANACNYLQFKGGGASGNPITLLFESGTVLTAPTWGAGCGAIYSTGHSNITINGGNAGCAVSGSAIASEACATAGPLSGGGMIQATANGTGLTYHVNGNGVLLYSCSNCTVKNLLISNIYVHTSLSDELGDPTGAVYIDGGSNVVVTNNVAHDMKWAIQDSFNNGDTNVQFYGNQVYNADHGFVIATGGTGAAFTYGYIYNNWYHDPGNWDDNGNLNHHDGAHLWTFGAGNSLTHSYVYDNLFSGNFGTHMNSAVYEEAFTAGSDAWVFNNVIAPSAGSSGNGYVGLGANGGSGAWSVVNNTIVGYNNTGTGTALNSNSTAGTVYNNLVSILNGAIYVQTGPAAIDNQDYYDIGSSGWTGGSSLSGWVSWCPVNYSSTVGCDAHSLSTDPNLTGGFVPNSGSPVIAAGKNFYSTCNGQPNPGLGALCYDAAGGARPSSGNWDIGAFQYSSSQNPAPPTGLTAAVN